MKSYMLFILLLCGILLSGAIFVGPWIQFTARYSACPGAECLRGKPQNPDPYGPGINLNVRFWQEPYLNAYCPALYVYFESAAIERRFTELRFFGWFVIAAQIVPWLFFGYFQRKNFPESKPRSFLILVVFYIILGGYLVSNFLRPASSCDGMLGLLIQKASLALPALLLPAINLAIGISAASISGLKQCHT